MLTIHLESNERIFDSAYVILNNLERRTKLSATFGTVLYTCNSRRKYLKEILHIKLCNMNSGNIHQTLINWGLKMLMSSTWGRKQGEGEKSRRNRKEGQETLKENSFHKFLILDYCLRFNTAKNRPESNSVLQYYTALITQRHSVLKRCQPA